MAHPLVLVTGLSMLAGVYANDDIADVHQGLLAKYTSSRSSASKTSLVGYDKFMAQRMSSKRAGGLDALSHHSSPAEQDKAVQKLLADDSKMTIGYSAIGISFLTLAAMLGVRMRRRFASSGRRGSEMSAPMVPAVQDNILELRSQGSTGGASSMGNLRSKGWLQPSSQISCPLTVCYADGQEPKNEEDDAAALLAEAARLREEVSALEKEEKARVIQMNEAAAAAGANKPKSEETKRPARGTWSITKDMPAGIVDPTGFFDPLELSKDTSPERMKYFREAELKHGRVAMLAAFGFPVAEQFHPLFGGKIDAPSYIAFQQTPLQTFWPIVVLVIAAVEFSSSVSTFESPMDGEWWLLKEDHKPGDLGFDPLGLRPTNAKELTELQTKELNNGRLAMIAIAGMVGQELATGAKLFGGAGDLDF
jgi:hypothetical protein